MKISELQKMASSFGATLPMPVLFLGHGSPMNAIEENEFVRGWREAGKTIPRPNAILCVSAHWETRGTYVTAMKRPRTIHDFGGFPEALFQVQYPASGSPVLAEETRRLITKTAVALDDQWGLDHGAWSVIKHLYPAADVPVIEMSLDYSRTPQFHYDLARELEPLRRKGILIIGSGNMVHNLRLVAWDKFQLDDYGYDWAVEAASDMKKYILGGDDDALIHYTARGKAFSLAIPTPEHYLPLLYVLALRQEHEPVALFNDKAVAGSLSMACVRVG